MADTSGDSAPGAGAQQPAGPTFSIRAQYVKDLSFENPQAPKSLATTNERPKIDVNIGVRSTRMSETEFEVELSVSAKAGVGEQTAFVVELKYGGVFGLANFPADQIQPIVMVECPRLLFPFARQIIANATRDGGFPPLMLEPIDFLTMFRRQQQEQAARAGAPGDGGAAAPTSH